MRGDSHVRFGGEVVRLEQLALDDLEVGSEASRRAALARGGPLAPSTAAVAIARSSLPASGDRAGTPTDPHVGQGPVGGWFRVPYFLAGS